MNLPVRSQFVTILSVLSMTAGLYFVVQNISLLSMQNSPEMQLAQKFMPTAFVSPGEIFLEMALNAVLVIASIGLWLRHHWGRVSYMIVVCVITAWEIYSSLHSYFILRPLLSGFGLGNSLTLIAVWSLLGVGVAFYVIKKLSSEEIRSEFRRS